MNILLIGMGQFGSALSKIFENQGIRVLKIRNSDSKPDLSKEDLSKFIAILCLPTQEIPKMIAQRINTLNKCHSVLSAAKGIIQSEGVTPGQHLEQKIKNKNKILILSGPSFASELKRGMPTALVLAGKDRARVDYFTNFLSGPQLRLYKSHDPLGVELSGALKNIYAIGAGIIEGLGLGLNTRMAFTTRSLAEMVRVGSALGGKPMTFFGLAGVGDLFLTCSSQKSRNFQMGLGLAKKKNKKSLLKKLGTVEGLWTSYIAREICIKKRIKAPALETIVSIIKGQLSPELAKKRLMLRESRHEF